MAFLPHGCSYSSVPIFNMCGHNVSVGSNSWRRARLLCNHTTGKTKRNSNRHIRWSQNGDGILSCCLWRRSRYYQGSRLHQKNIPWLLWSAREVYETLNRYYKILICRERENKRDLSFFCLYNQSSADEKPPFSFLFVAIIILDDYFLKLSLLLFLRLWSCSTQ